MTPERRMDLSMSHERLTASHSHRHRATPDKPIPVPATRHHPSAETESGDEDSVVVKKEPRDDESEAPAMSEEEPLRQQPSPNDVVVKKEVVDESRDDEEPINYGATNHRRGSVHENADEPQLNPPTPRAVSQVEQVAQSPCRNSTSSPASSDRSVTPRGTPDTKASSSLGALSSMFDSLSGGGGATSGNTDSQGRKTSSHPLAALQKLCDKTETRGGSGSSGSGSRSASGGGATIGAASSSGSGTSGPGPGPTPGAILAFSWACNDAVVTADSIMKCAFCDTPFISKGAYRHHLSKMHFVKDGVIPDPMTISRSAAAAAAAAAAAVAGQPPAGGGGPSRGSTSPPSTQRNKSPPAPQANGSPSQPAASPLEESPHSKFLKYTELAKQLSSKYV